jgi:ribonuclease HI
MHILIDHSTIPTDPEKNRWGKSVAAWCAWKNRYTEGKPVRCGIHYFDYEGPHRAFYKGIIQALEQCLDLCRNDAVIVFGDDKLVIDLLRERKPGNVLKELYYKVQSLIYEHCRQNNEVYFVYLSEKDKVYRKIDKLAGYSQEFIRSVLENKDFAFPRARSKGSNLPF